MVRDAYNSASRGMNTIKNNCENDCRSKGGSNSYSNAQVLACYEKILKSDT